MNNNNNNKADPPPPLPFASAHQGAGFNQQTTRILGTKATQNAIGSLRLKMNEPKRSASSFLRREVGSYSSDSSGRRVAQATSSCCSLKTASAQFQCWLTISLLLVSALLQATTQDGSVTDATRCKARPRHFAPLRLILGPFFHFKKNFPDRPHKGKMMRQLKSSLKGFKKKKISQNDNLTFDTDEKLMKSAA